MTVLQKLEKLKYFNLHTGTIPIRDYEHQPIECILYELHNKLMICRGTNNISSGGKNGFYVDVYYLPFQANSGTYIDVPLYSKHGTYFFTDNLSGCCVGFKIEKYSIRICHYNLTNRLFSNNDLSLYNTWLLPSGSTAGKYYQNMNLRNKYIYQIGNNHGKRTCIWGEYSFNYGWIFFYQTPDFKIHQITIF
ncbi:MAG: hypothetical protein LBE79_07840 [Tannerella sp.]|jgi:hypothetical protein|nr:hypothetical protein [Tannerella sp.]